MTNPDLSGMLRFLTDELQAAEDARDSVWIMGHVLTGWDGTNPLQNPTDLCKSSHHLLGRHHLARASLQSTKCERHIVSRLSYVFNSPGLYSVDRFSPHVIKGMLLHHP